MDEYFTISLNLMVMLHFVSLVFTFDSPRDVSFTGIMCLNSNPSFFLLKFIFLLELLDLQLFIAKICSCPADETS